ncbi:hypothetical protein [Saccharothrix texasensis]|uniref:Uncharacterized protein n=1 Tax=Saccharothrix texasensis TaxID=103734 RepID=A0A3N1GZ43_9PSEU|nr:hypothetical protein [Saccharothrix texasensis]ROP35518.1 hypothetical protein EDD40_0749 [Saccharothrix texasensis]
MSGPGFVEVNPVGRGSNPLWRLISAVILATGPVIAAFGYVDGGADSAQLYVGGVLSLFLVPIGIGAWRATTRARNRLLRLEAVGLPATGEVLTAENDGGEVTNMILTVRISGPGTPPFETTVTTQPGPGTKPGSRLTVLVDPDDGTFLIRDFEDADFLSGSHDD